MSRCPHCDENGDIPYIGSYGSTWITCPECHGTKTVESKEEIAIPLPPVILDPSTLKHPDLAEHMRESLRAVGIPSPSTLKPE